MKSYITFLSDTKSDTHTKAVQALTNSSCSRDNRSWAGTSTRLSPGQPRSCPGAAAQIGATDESLGQVQGSGGSSTVVLCIFGGITMLHRAAGSSGWLLFAPRRCSSAAMRGCLLRAQPAVRSTEPVPSPSPHKARPHEPHSAPLSLPRCCYPGQRSDPWLSGARTGFISLYGTEREVLQWIFNSACSKYTLL